MSLTDCGIREDKYVGVRWEIILKNKVNLWVSLLCSSDSHPISLYKAVIEISSVVPYCFKLDFFLTLVFRIENNCPILHPHIQVKV